MRENKEPNSTDLSKNASELSVKLRWKLSVKNVRLKLRLIVKNRSVKPRNGEQSKKEEELKSKSNLNWKSLREKEDKRKLV